MRNEKIIFISLVLTSSFLILVYFWGLRKEFHRATEEKKSSDATVQKLQSQLKQLAELRDSVKNSEAMLQEELKKEKQRVLNLQEDLKKSTDYSKILSAKLSQAKSERKKTEWFGKKVAELALKNETLRKALEDSRRKFELIEPIKEKLLGIKLSLAALEVTKGKGELLSLQLDSLSKELGAINNYMLQLLENNISPIKDYQVLGEKTEEKASSPRQEDFKKYEEEIGKLRIELSESQRQQVLFKQQYQDALDQLAQARSELNARAEKIFTSQEKIMSAENNLFEMRINFKEMEKDAAILREKYVAGELEKSGIQIALDQTRQELAQLQGKFLSLLGRIGGIFKPPEDTLPFNLSEKLIRTKNAKIDVELIPQAAK